MNFTEAFAKTPAPVKWFGGGLLAGIGAAGTSFVSNPVVPWQVHAGVGGLAMLAALGLIPVAPAKTNAGSAATVVGTGAAAAGIAHFFVPDNPMWTAGLTTALASYVAHNVRSPFGKDE